MNKMNVSQWMDGNRKTSNNGMTVGLLQCYRLNSDDSHCLSHHQHVVCYYVQRHTTPSSTTLSIWLQLSFDAITRPVAEFKTSVTKEDNHIE